MLPLHVHSNFSLLRGASTVEELVGRAAELGYRGLALTDRDALYGTVRFAKACAEQKIQPIFGSEVTLADSHHLTLLAESQTGYANLCRLISLAHQDQPKGEAALPFSALAEHAEGIIALSGPRTGEIPRLLVQRRRHDAVAALDRYREVFGDRFSLELQNHQLPDDRWLMAELAGLGKARGVRLVATTDVHYHQPERRMLQDVLTCIRTKTTMAALSLERLPNASFALPAPDELARRFKDYPDALAHTDAIAERCSLTKLDFRTARFPPLDLPNGEDPDAALRRLCAAGARRLFRPVTEPVSRQLDHELAVIAQAGLAPFFLIATDVARRFHGRCRGSAAGSLVVYCLGVSAVDPLRYGMLFERFINPERPTLPDIDVDYAEWDREAAIAYIYQTYGADRAAMVCNYVRYRARLAVRDVGRVLGMPNDLLARLAKSLDHGAISEDLAQGIADFATGERVDDDTNPSGSHLPPTQPSPGATAADPQPWLLLTKICQDIDDFPRHLSIHVGGMLVTGQPLIELFGLEPARKAGIVVVGGDKEDVEDVGLGKLDLLVLRALSVIQEAAGLEEGRGVPLDLPSIGLEDPEIYAMLRRADTMGASQIESRAQMQSVVRTMPRNFRDLINQCAIIRPGPIVAGMVHPYNRRRIGLEKVTFLHPSLAPITGDTLGIFLFQEQIILGVMALTGCSAGEADVFRRAMGSHRSREAMQRLQPWFIERAVAHDIELATATEAFRQISGFADFGFCRSHSAALARTAYEGLFLKRYHPAAFYAALVSNQPMGFYPVEVLIWDGRRHGIHFLPVDANLSAARCTLSSLPAFDPLDDDEENPADRRLAVRGASGLPPQPPIRLGFEQVRWVGRDIAARIVRERDASGPYRSLADFCQRTGLTGKPAEGLVLAGGFDFEGQARQDQLWQLYGHVGSPGKPALGLSEEEAELPERTIHDQVLLDHLVLSFSLEQHLVESYRRRLRALGVTPSHLIGRIPDGREVRVGGLVVCRQRPGTAKGFVFLTIEDEHGLVNVVIRPDVYRQYREALRNSMLVAVAGKIQKAFGTINIVANRAVSLDPRVPDAEVLRRSSAPIEAGVRSHDFH